jgi:endonuclease-3
MECTTIMATTINKKRLLSQIMSAAKKVAEVPDEPQPVLEQFIYALCREDATPEQAERAFAYLRERFYDWNEVRVSSTRELEEAFEDMSCPDGRAQRLVLFLQEVFETRFSFDLDYIRKKGLKDGARQLMRFQAADDFVGAWVVQRSLAGHAIPLDPPTLRTARRLGLLEGESESLESARASLEHLIEKKLGPQFTDAMSHIADRYCHEEAPRCGHCPLASDCTAAIDGTVEPAPTRPSRPKPR